MLFRKLLLLTDHVCMEHVFPWFHKPGPEKAEYLYKIGEKHSQLLASRFCNAPNHEIQVINNYISD